jgi:ABC-type transport system substrate-binding protein
MRWSWPRLGLGLGVLGMLWVSACAPAAPASAPAGAQSGAAPAGQAAPAQTGPKTLKVGVLQEPRDGIILFAPGGLPALQYAFTFQTGLTVYDAAGKLQPRMAQKVPTVADGDWLVRPDGSMAVTWKLQSNLQWHDGAPVTADDFVFGIELLNDKEVPLAHSTGQRLITGATAPDPQTLVVEWKSPFVTANAGGPTSRPCRATCWATCTRVATSKP